MNRQYKAFPEGRNLLSASAGRVSLLGCFLIGSFAFSCTGTTQPAMNAQEQTVSVTKSDTVIPLADTTGSDPHTDNRKIGWQSYDDPLKPNCIIDNFASLQKHAQKMSLPIDLAAPERQWGDTTREFFATRSFIETHLDQKHLFNLLRPREDRLTWRGAAEQLYFPEEDYFPVQEAGEVIELGAVMQLANDNHIRAFSFNQLGAPAAGGQYPRSGSFLVFFDSTGVWLNGFESGFSLGNRHGAFRIETKVDKNMNFLVTIQDWADMINPDGHTIETTLRLEQKKIKRLAYKRKNL